MQHKQSKMSRFLQKTMQKTLLVAIDKMARFQYGPVQKTIFDFAFGAAV